MKPVLHKRDFVLRYMNGEFGNRSPTWDNLKEFTLDRDKDGDALYHIRNRVKGGPTFYDLRIAGVHQCWRSLVQKGIQPSSLYISQMCPTERTKIQGEVMQSEHYIDLWYSKIAKPMREALALESYHVNGLTAVIQLRKYLCASSWAWMQELLENYPHHVIEFTTFDVCWGTVTNYNTVFWEVRSY